MSWEPSTQEIEDKLIEMAYVWGDIEEELVRDLTEVEQIFGGHDLWKVRLGQVAGQAFRVEAVFTENDFGDPCSIYQLLFDVADAEARAAARELEKDDTALRDLVREMARPFHSRDFLEIKMVPASTPVSGQICRRAGEAHPVSSTPTLDDVPVRAPIPGSVDLVERDGHLLTPIEAPFYDALRDTGLTVSVQPFISGPGGSYRVDFLVFYDGQAYAIELDGHDYHKTKEQRTRDAAREHWFEERKIRVFRGTGTQVFRDPQSCVTQLLNILRGPSARP